MYHARYPLVQLQRFPTAIASKDAATSTACSKSPFCASLAWGLWTSRGTYSPEAHAGLAQMYLADDRFRAYYDAWAPGATELLVHAIERAAR
ncbi:MAG: TipAS antibiotic-recognition domain-containing protein [Olsenella umbonata]|nr:TipAS antibiotic-recognition domain-containing protein [Parafannyhessea umbonata]